MEISTTVIITNGRTIVLIFRVVRWRDPFLDFLQEGMKHRLSVKEVRVVSFVSTDSITEVNIVLTYILRKSIEL